MNSHPPNQSMPHALMGPQARSPLRAQAVEERLHGPRLGIPRRVGWTLSDTLTWTVPDVWLYILNCFCWSVAFYIKCVFYIIDYINIYINQIFHTHIYIIYIILKYNIMNIYIYTILYIINFPLVPSPSATTPSLSKSQRLLGRAGDTDGTDDGTNGLDEAETGIQAVLHGHINAFFRAGYHR